MENVLPFRRSYCTFTSGHIREASLEGTDIVYINNLLWQSVVDPNHVKQGFVIDGSPEHALTAPGIELFVMPWGASRIPGQEMSQSSMTMTKNTFVKETENSDVTTETRWSKIVIENTLDLHISNIRFALVSAIELN